MDELCRAPFCVLLQQSNFGKITVILFVARNIVVSSLFYWVTVRIGFTGSSKAMGGLSIVIRLHPHLQVFSILCVRSVSSKRIPCPHSCRSRKVARVVLSTFSVVVSSGVQNADRFLTWNCRSHLHEGLNFFCSSVKGCHLK